MIASPPIAYHNANIDAPGIDVRDGAPGTRETDALRESQGAGFDADVVRVPVVPAAVLFDLAIGDPHIRPDAAELVVTFVM